MEYRKLGRTGLRVSEICFGTATFGWHTDESEAHRMLDGRIPRFMLLAVGTVLAALVFFLGVIAYVYSVVKKHQAERGAVLTGLVVSVVILGLLLLKFCKK